MRVDGAVYNELLAAADIKKTWYNPKIVDVFSGSLSVSEMNAFPELLIDSSLHISATLRRVCIRLYTHRHP